MQVLFVEVDADLRESGILEINLQKFGTNSFRFGAFRQVIQCDFDIIENVRIWRFVIAQRESMTIKEA